MNKIINSTLILTTILLASCASTKQYAIFPEESLDEDQSRIYVIRSSIWGSALKMGVFENETLIGTLGPKGYLKWDVSGPEITLYSKAENKSSLTIDLTPGETYYVKQAVRMGIVTARSRLEVLGEEEALEKLKKAKKPKLKYSESDQQL